MLRVLWNLVSRTKGVTNKQQPAGPALFESLEPRLLLNADLAVAQPLPAEFAATDAAVYVDLDQQSNSSQADPTSVLTLNLEPGAGVNLPETEPQVVSPVDPQQVQLNDGTLDLCGQAGPTDTDPILAPVLSQVAGEQVESGLVAGAEASGSLGVFQDEQADPAVPDQQDITLSSETPSIEIRGPPSRSYDSVNPLYETIYGEGGQVSASDGVGGVSTQVSLAAPDLPGLRLVDPDISNWQGQIVYLDFDGEQNVTYQGPVTVGSFDVPAFSLEGTALAGQEGAIIAEVVTRLQEIFAGSGVIFTTERPADGTPYSTIWIGGDDSAFSAYGSFLGLAEQVDVGNAVATDSGLVFSDELLGTSAGADAFVDRLSRTIAHEGGHLLGYEHDVLPDDSSTGGSALSQVALPEIAVLGNGLSIADGDTTPSAGDHTNFGSVAQGGTPISRTFTVRNDGTSTLTLGAVTVPTGYTLTKIFSSSIAPGASDTFTVRLDTATAGTKGGDVSFSNDDSDENPFNFRITGTVTAAATMPAEEFVRGLETFDLSNKALLFVPDGSVYTFTIRSITALPTNPAGGTRLTLSDDDAVEVTLGSSKTVVLYGQSYGSFYIGSNGYITFTSSDLSYWETLTGHFNRPRISVLFDDLNPEAGGQVGWQQLADRAVVTWDQVPDVDTESICTLQATMYFDGRIELAWLAMASVDGIVGLSDGSGLPADFTETDFSKAPPSPSEITVLGNGVSITNGDATPGTDDHTDFGTVVQGETVISRMFTVRNDGIATLTLGAVTLPTGFMLSEPLSTSLAPGATDTFTVWMDMSVAGTHSGDISFSTNDSDENPFHFRITGTVVMAPEITVLGNGIVISNGSASPRFADHTDFGSVALDDTATYRTFTVRNDGGTTLTLGAVSVPLGFTVAEGLAASLAPGASDTFTIQLDTSPLGVKSGDIVFSTNDADENPFQFRIAGVVVLLAEPEMDVLGRGISIVAGDMTAGLDDGTDFGTVDVGRPALRTYTIENTGSALLYLTGSPRVTIGGSSDFSVVVQPDASVATGGSTTFLIRFHPSSAGVKTATISIANSDGDESPYTFSIQGAGVAWDFVFYDDFDDGDFAGWSAVDPVTGAPTTAPDVVASPEGWALRGIGSGYVQDPALNILLTRDLPTGNLGELKIEMRAKAGPERPNATQVQLIKGSDYYTVVDYAMDGWNLHDRADWYSWVGGAAQQLSSEIAGPPGAWHDFAWVRDAQGQWSLSIDGQLQAVGFQMDNQLRSFTKLAISLLRNQSEIEWIAISGNTLSPGVFAVPVYRFWSPKAAHHFYTISAQERDKLINQFSGSWIYEGIAFSAFPNGDQAGTVPLYRLWSPRDNLHLFTMDKAQRDNMIATYPRDIWTSEGIAFYIYPVTSHPADASAVYRFRSLRTSMYFFTMSTVERDYVLAKYPKEIWTYEDEAWYAYGA